MNKKIIFFYNAKKGRLNSIIDFFHKSISPKTYSCNLCAITYGFRRKKKWSEFIENFKLKIEFYYKDELEKYNLSKYENYLPCCFIKERNNYKLLIDRSTMNHLANEEELMKLIKLKVN